MRTTLTLDADLAGRIAWFRETRKMSLRDTVNTAMRKGLTAMAEPGTTPTFFPTRSRTMRTGVTRSVSPEMTTAA